MRWSSFSRMQIGAISDAPVSRARRARVSRASRRLADRLVELRHRRVQRGGAPQQQVGDPAEVEQQLVVERFVEDHHAVDEVGDEQRDDARGQQVERRPAADRCRARGGSRRRAGGCRRADRRPTRASAAAPAWGRAGTGVISRIHDSSDSPSVRIAASISVLRLLLWAAPAHEQQQPEHQRRVDRQVDGVADRGERDFVVEDVLRVAVRVEVAQPVQAEAEREQVPGQLVARPVAPDPDEHGHPAREARAR